MARPEELLQGTFLTIKDVSRAPSLLYHESQTLFFADLGQKSLS